MQLPPSNQVGYRGRHGRSGNRVAAKARAACPSAHNVCPPGSLATFECSRGCSVSVRWVHVCLGSGRSRSRVRSFNGVMSSHCPGSWGGQCCWGHTKATRFSATAGLTMLNWGQMGRQVNRCPTRRFKQVVSRHTNKCPCVQNQQGYTMGLGSGEMLGHHKVPATTPPITNLL